MTQGVQQLLANLLQASLVATLFLCSLDRERLQQPRQRRRRETTIAEHGIAQTLVEITACLEQRADVIEIS